MKRLIINIQDNLYDPIIILLKHLGKDKVEIISSETLSDGKKSPLNAKIKDILAKNKTKLFRDIKDPVAWQREERNEWK